MFSAPLNLFCGHQLAVYHHGQPSPVICIPPPQMTIQTSSGMWVLPCTPCVVMPMVCFVPVNIQMVPMDTNYCSIPSGQYTPYAQQYTKYSHPVMMDTAQEQLQDPECPLYQDQEWEHQQYIPQAQEQQGEKVLDAVDMVHTNDVLAAEDTVPAAVIEPIKDFVPAEDNVPATDIVPAEDNVSSEDIVLAAVNVPSEDIVHAEDNVPSEDIVHAKVHVPAEDIEPVEDIVPTEDIVPKEYTVPAMDSEPVDVLSAVDMQPSVDKEPALSPPTEQVLESTGEKPRAERGPAPDLLHYQQGQCNQPRKVISWVSFNADDIQLNKAENAWRPAVRRTAHGPSGGQEDQSSDTQGLFGHVRSILNKLTPEKFEALMRQVTQLRINTEERLRGVINLLFEKAVSEPTFSRTFANLCLGLSELSIPSSDQQASPLLFHKLLLKHCQEEFKTNKFSELCEEKQRELETAKENKERRRLKEELEEALDKARRRSLGIIRFIGELFTVKLLTVRAVLNYTTQLLKTCDVTSLECLCTLLSTVGKDLDSAAKPRMNHYFSRIEKEIMESDTSSRMRFLLQDIVDLRQNNWVPRKGDQGPKKLEEIHKEAKLEEVVEKRKVQLQSQKESMPPQDRSVCRPRSPGSSYRPGNVYIKPAAFNNLSQKDSPEDSSPVASPPQDFKRTLPKMTMSARPSPPARAWNESKKGEMLQRVSSMIEEYLQKNDLNEEVEYVRARRENSRPLLFVRCGFASTNIKHHLNLLQKKLISVGVQTKELYCKGSGTFELKL